MSPRQIEIPHDWRPRGYQMPFWQAMQRGCKRAQIVWHRRAGKDDVCLRWTSVAALDPRSPAANYWYMLPVQEQVRKAVWTARNPHTGKKRIHEAFPPEVVDGKPNETDMSITLANNSMVQFLGADNYDTQVGAPPKGIVFSEWPLTDPMAWDYYRPILLENGGWAIFNGTPRGRNHAYNMINAASDDDEWFTQILKADRTGVFTKEQLNRELFELITLWGPDEGQARFDQEYMCSFNAPVTGAYYAKLITQAEREGRICSVPYDASALCWSSWDLGKTDDTVIWVWQLVGHEIRIIDFYRNRGHDLAHYAAWILRKPYEWAGHWLPHDGAHDRVENKFTAQQRLEIELGLQEVRIAPAPAEISRQAGINQVRKLMPRMWIDEKRCFQGIEGLRSYRSEYVPDRDATKTQPVHDWASHVADAMRTGAIVIDRMEIPHISIPTIRAVGVV